MLKWTCGANIGLILFFVYLSILFGESSAKKRSAGKLKGVKDLKYHFELKQAREDEIAAKIDMYEKTKFEEHEIKRKKKEKIEEMKRLRALRRTTTTTPKPLKIFINNPVETGLSRGDLHVMDVAEINKYLLQNVPKEDLPSKKTTIDYNKYFRLSTMHKHEDHKKEKVDKKNDGHSVFNKTLNTTTVTATFVTNADVAEGNNVTSHGKNPLKIIQTKIKSSKRNIQPCPKDGICSYLTENPNEDESSNHTEPVKHFSTKAIIKHVSRHPVEKNTSKIQHAKITTEQPKNNYSVAPEHQECPLNASCTHLIEKSKKREENSTRTSKIQTRTTIIHEMKSKIKTDLIKKDSVNQNDDICPINASCRNTTEVMMASENSTDTRESPVKHVENVTETSRIFIETNTTSTKTSEIPLQLRIIMKEKSIIPKETTEKPKDTTTIPNPTRTSEHNITTKPNPTETSEHNTITKPNPTKTSEHNTTTKPNPTETSEHNTTTKPNPTKTSEHNTITKPNSTETTPFPTQTSEHTTESSTPTSVSQVTTQGNEIRNRNATEPSSSTLEADHTESSVESSEEDTEESTTRRTTRIRTLGRPAVYMGK